MDPISKTGAKGNHTPAASTGPPNADPFSRTLKLAKAGELLRHTAQFDKWTQLCQKSDDLADKVADILLKRNELLQAAKTGGAVDRQQFDALTEALEKNGIVLLKSAALMAQTGRPSTPEGNPRSQVSKENPLVLSLEYENHVLNSGLLGYGDSERLFLPLGEISRTLDFSIEVNSAQGTASGWFVAEDRAFSLDLSRLEVSADGKKMHIPKDGVAVADGEIYVDAGLLSQWFPVDFSYDFSHQAVRIMPREKLAFQQRMEREQAWKLSGGSQAHDPVLPRVYSEYGLFSPPFVDMGLTTSYTKGSKADDEFSSGFESGFYLLSKGDLAGMTSEIYLSGEDQDGLENSRLTLRRDDPDARLLGPLKATSVSAGDIRTADFPILGGGETEKGIALSNENLNRSRNFDTTFFEGNLPPGWQVEVYRNNMLVGTQRVGEEGKYNFEDIPIYYGKNDFRLKFYGPQGQEREETKRIDVGGDLLKKGSGEYALSLTQKDVQVYEPDKIGHTRDEESLKLNARYDYGLAKNLSVGGGVSSQEVDKERHHYINLGAKGNLEGISLGGDYIHDTEGGDAVEMLAQTGLGKLDLNLRQRFYRDFTEDNGAGVSDPLKSETGVSVSGALEGEGNTPLLPFTLTYRDIQRENAHYGILGSRISSNIRNMHLNNYLQWTESNALSGDHPVLDGSFQAITQVGNLRVRGKLDYALDPRTEIESAEISGFLNLDKDLSTEVILKKDMEEDVNEGILRLNWNNGKIAVSPQVSYDSEGEMTAFLSFSTSLGREPRSKKIHASSAGMADGGAASVKVYHDKNNNQAFDPGDEALPGVSVKAVQSYREAETDENGVAFLTLLPKNKPTDLVLDKDTLEDPFLEPSAQGVSMAPRPGHVQEIEIPVVTTGEIDGTLLTGTEDGREIPVANASVQLVDGSGKVAQTVRSEHDGFYYFQKVFPGTYSIRIDPGDSSQAGKTSRAVSVDIDPQGTLVSGKDIFLERTPVAAVVPEPGPKPILPVISPISEEMTPAAAEAATPAAEIPQAAEGVQKFGLHLTSYRTPEKPWKASHISWINIRANWAAEILPCSGSMCLRKKGSGTG
nr:carboxypeptidase regulatory-like domain-containing protein [Desulfobacula sp.]